MSDGSALRIGVVQCVSRPAADIGPHVRAAACAGLDLVVLPELFPCGYGSAAVAAGEPADGPFARRVATLARETGVAVAVGCPERGEDGRLYNAATLVDGTGARRAHHRKAHLFGSWERAVFTPGCEAPPVVELRGFRVALMVCYDLEFPEYARLPAAAGADALLVPTAVLPGVENVQRLLVPARALENQCVVAYANFGGPEFGGLSAVAGPDGHVLARAGAVEDVLLTATVTSGGIAAARADQCYLDDRRPRLYGSGG